MYVVKSDKNGRKRWAKILLSPRSSKGKNEGPPKEKKNRSSRMGFPDGETVKEAKTLIENSGLKDSYDVLKTEFLIDLIQMYKESPVDGGLEFQIELLFIPITVDVSTLDSRENREKYKILFEGRLPNISTASGIYRNLHGTIGNLSIDDIEKLTFPDEED